jgi:hypothetical protein
LERRVHPRKPPSGGGGWHNASPSWFFIFRFQPTAQPPGLHGKFRAQIHFPNHLSTVFSQETGEKSLALTSALFPVEMRWKNRFTACRPWVVPGAQETLLGAIPLEDMDLMVDPTQQRLVGVHGEEEMGYLYAAT